MIAVILKPCLFFCNPCARAVLCLQERARKLSSATLKALEFTLLRGMPVAEQSLSEKTIVLFYPVYFDKLLTDFKVAS